MAKSMKTNQQFSEQFKGRKPPKKFIPIGDRVAVWPHVVRETAGGLLLPDNAASPDQSCTATVIAVGPLCKQVKEGDQVIVADMIPTSVVNQTGDNYLVLQEGLITGVLNPKEDMESKQNE